MTITTKPASKGPASYENWRAQLSGEELQVVHEYPLFTDAHVVGEILVGLGPYEIINTVPMPHESRLRRPSLILRTYEHINTNPPASDRTLDEHYHGGTLPDEITALISLCLGLRLKAGGATRVFGADNDLRGRPIAYGLGDDPILSIPPERPIVRSALGMHSLEGASLLGSLQSLSVSNAITLVRAARNYQEALWISEATPELSWIMLTSSIETVAGHWRKAKELPVERLRTSRPNLVQLLLHAGGDDLLQEVAIEIAPYMGATKTFIDFMLHFLPPPPPVRPYEFAQLLWEQQAMKKTLRQIYDYRSRALHGGHPFPGPMCIAPISVNENGTPEEVPIGLSVGMKGAVWMSKDLPMHLHTFEYIVRNTILNWWQSVRNTETWDPE